MADNVLSKVAIVFSGDTAGLKKDIGKAEGYLSGFQSNVGKIAGAIGGVFAVKEIAAFAFEVSKLAGEAEGVRLAFEKLPNSIQLMGDLKDATAGTVSELDLMKRSVQAANFGISMEALPKLLEFAAVRAQQTGQSVDYLVDSIVTGIGRKSPLILDNLGISAVALKDKMNGVSLATASVGEVAEAVGKIANDNLKTMGDLAETAAVKTERLSASWTNFKVAIGNAANQTGILDKSLNILTNTLSAFGGDQFTKGINELMANRGAASEILESFAAAGGKIDLSWQELMARGFLRNEEAAKKYEKILKQIQTSTIDLKRATDSVDPITGLPSTGGKAFDSSKIAKQVDTLAILQDRLKDLNTAFEDIAVTDQKTLTIKGQEIIAIGKQIEALEKLRKARKDSLLAANSIEFYKAQLSTLNDELEKVNATDTSRIRILSAQIAGYDEAIQKIESLKKSMAGIDVSLKVPDLQALLDPITKLRTIKVAEGLKLDIDISLSDQVKQRFEKSMDDFQKSFVSKSQQIKSAVESVDIGGVVAGQIAGLAEAFGSALVGVGNFGDAIIKSLASFAKQMGEILIAAGVGAIVLKNLAKNPVLTVAAGVALIALAGAAQSAVSKRASTALGGGGTPATRLTGTDAASNNQLTLTGELTTRIQGSELLIVLERAQASRKRG